MRPRNPSLLQNYPAHRLQFTTPPKMGTFRPSKSCITSQERRGDDGFASYGDKFGIGGGDYS